MGGVEDFLFTPISTMHRDGVKRRVKGIRKENGNSFVPLGIADKSQTNLYWGTKTSIHDSG